MNDEFKDHIFTNEIIFLYYINVITRIRSNVLFFIFNIQSHVYLIKLLPIPR